MDESPGREGLVGGIRLTDLFGFGKVFGVDGEFTLVVPDHGEGDDEEDETEDEVGERRGFL